ncbi:MAG: hypothetical protein A2896_01320 [Candidatus Nealsonbacteria bacterium RIFCSPLOWO2_01_FULL_43_32]|uniref:DUF1893 domain-containing protein n=1 Tax=Candidatus Nealsonbacteria bacterium RIFCSPLOWO2_01_FULL_43_32 TaxID=1801672 RepID=A0A1G2EDV3_9BACT|nr:MAG: hypothetical protein A2896_01320 [Candidatus Nealsonbacteria bacterium RIFCSPLOWO2_01_FULL_43_32]
MKQKFEKFLKSSWGLEIWLACPPKSRLAGRRRGNLIFRSKKAGVAGLLAFIQKHDKKYSNLVIFDKIVGRGAALLAAYLKAKEIYGKTGSKLAAKSLRKYKIKFYSQKTVPNILNRDQTGLCPFEKLSLGKTPEKFYKCLIK